MICDALQEDEIFEAYLLYASLHGLETDEAHVRSRITSYLNNQPDSTIDEAIVAFADDSIVAPPDIVLERWGKSRIYELVETPQQEWRHQVCESWFENDCEFYFDDRDPPLSHFWTNFDAWPLRALDTLTLPRGTRVQFKMHASTIVVAHRHFGPLGTLPGNLIDELGRRSNCQARFLALIDSEPLEAKQVIADHPEQLRRRLLVTVATGSLAIEHVAAYASYAFNAVRCKC